MVFCLYIASIRLLFEQKILVTSEDIRIQSFNMCYSS